MSNATAATALLFAQVVGFGDVVEHQHHTFQGAVRGADRGRRVGDLELGSGAGNDGRVVGEADRAPGGQDLQHRVGQGAVVEGVERVEYRGDVAAGGFRPRPAGQGFGHRIEALDAALGIGDDDAVADRFQDPVEALAAAVELGDIFGQRALARLERPCQTIQRPLARQGDPGWCTAEAVGHHSAGDGLDRPIDVAAGEQDAAQQCGDQDGGEDAGLAQQVAADRCDQAGGVDVHVQQGICRRAQLAAEIADGCRVMAAQVAVRPDGERAPRRGRRFEDGGIEAGKGAACALAPRRQAIGVEDPALGIEQRQIAQPWPVVVGRQQLIAVDLAEQLLEAQQVAAPLRQGLRLGLAHARRIIDRDPGEGSDHEQGDRCQWHPKLQVDLPDGGGAHGEVPLPVSRQGDSRPGPGEGARG